MCVLGGEVLQGLLVVTAVDVVAVDLQDDLAGLKTRRCRLPACSMCQHKIRGQRSQCGITVELYTTHWDIIKTRHLSRGEVLYVSLTGIMQRIMQSR